MREILVDEVFKLALIVIKDANMPLELSTDDEQPEVVSVRRLSRVVGYNTAVAVLLRMGDPISDPPPEEEADYAPENNK